MTQRIIAAQHGPLMATKRGSYNTPNRYDAAPRYEARGGYERSSFDRGPDPRVVLIAAHGSREL